MKPTDRELAALARLVGATAEREIDCEVVLERVADYLAHCAAGEPLCARLRAVAQHFAVCPQCLEEFAALLRAEGLDPRAIFGA